MKMTELLPLKVSHSPKDYFSTEPNKNTLESIVMKHIIRQISRLSSLHQSH